MRKAEILEWAHKHKLFFCAFCALALVTLYSLIIVAFFRTPKTSYWSDDATYGNTKYFHFREGNDEWSELLPIEPTQKIEGSYRLAIIELDEYGDFFQSKDSIRPEAYQLQCAKKMLSDATVIDNKPVLFFLYVHGWRHDASKEDTDLRGFKKLLGTLSKYGSSLFTVGDFKDLCGFVAKLRTLQDPLSAYLWNQFSASTQGLLTSVTSTPEQQKVALVQALDNILKGVLIFETVRFAGVTLSPETVALKLQNPQGTDLIRLNRLLLEDAYPLEIAKSAWTSKFTICGVYVGWRGASIRGFGKFTIPAEILSFWTRKSVAEKIASTPISSALFELIAAARSATPEHNNPSRIVLAGHSLGAGILMNSVSQGLAYEYARAYAEMKESGESKVSLESPANLILLLNPAVESVYLRQLRVSMQPVEGKHGYPWLVSLTSESDWVTKYCFGLAQTLQSSRSRKQPYMEVDWSHYTPNDSESDGAQDEPMHKVSPVSQDEYAKKTPGHNAHMLDLRVVVKKENSSEVESDDVIDYNMQHGIQKYFRLTGQDGFTWYGYFDTVRPKKAIHPLFWVAKVDPRIMKGHGLPFYESDRMRRDNFISMIVALIGDSRVHTPKRNPLLI